MRACVSHGSPESLSLAMGMDPSLSGTQWLTDVYPSLPPEARPDFECVQEAGEILCKSSDSQPIHGCCMRAARPTDD